MRVHLVAVTLAAALCCCGGGGGSSLAPSSIDGLWSGRSDGLGSTLTMSLQSKESAVTGTGTYSVGALRSGLLVVAGTYRLSSAVLTLTYDNGEAMTFASKSVGNEKMVGTLTQRTGTEIEIEFVRP